MVRFLLQFWLEKKKQRKEKLLFRNTHKRKKNVSGADEKVRHTGEEGSQRCPPTGACAWLT